MLALWPFGLGQFDFLSTPGKIIKYLGYAAFWTDLSQLDKNLYLLTVAFAAIFVLEIGFTIVIFYYCYSHSKFPLPLLYILRFFYEILPLIILIPLTAVSGVALYYIFDLSSLVYVPLVFGAILTLIQLFSFMKIYHLISLSAFMTRGAFNTFLPKALSTFTIFATGLVFVQCVAAKVSSSIQIVFQIAHLAISVLLIVYYFPIVPFESNFTNCSFYSLFTAHGFGALLTIVQHYAKYPAWINALIAFASFIVSFFIYQFLVNSREKKIEKKIKHDANGDTDIGDYLTQLGLLRDEKKMHLYIRIGFKHASGLFLNWSLIKNAIPAFPNSLSINFLAIQIICYFPSETRLLNSIYNDALNFRGLSMEHRFLIYQVYRIKLLRQSSASMSITEKLVEMKQITKDCYATVTSFWRDVPRDFTVLATIASQLSMAKQKWQNATQEHPNLQSFCEEYSKFCGECSTEFNIAIRQRNKVNLIEAGHNFMVDHCLRSMIRVNPFYIKKGFMDIKGNLIQQTLHKKTGASKSSNASTSKHGSSSASSQMIDENDIEAEEEELIGSQLFTQSKTRLAFQSALEGKRAKEDRIGTIYTILACVASIATASAIFTWLLEYFHPVVNSLTEQMKINDLNYYQSIGRFLTYYLAGEKMDAITFTEGWLAVKHDDSAATEEILNLESEDPWYDAAQLLYKARDYNSDLQALLVTDSFNGLDLWIVIPQFIQSITKLHFCTQSGEDDVITLSETRNTTYKALLAYQNAIALKNLEDISSHSASVEESKAVENVYTCCLLSSMESLLEANDKLFTSIVEYQDDYLHQTKNLLLILMIVIPVGLYLVTCIPMIVIVVSYHNDLKHLLQLMRNLNDKAKQEASQAIMKDHSFDQNEEGVKGSSTSSSSRNNLIQYILFLYFICPALSFLKLYLARIAATEFRRLSLWMFYGGQRLPLLSMSAEHLALAMIFKQHVVSFGDAKREIETGVELIEKVSTYQSILMAGSDKVTPLNGFDATLDKIHTASDCTEEEAEKVSSYSEAAEIHNSYKCISMSIAINVAEQLTMRLRDLLDSTDRELFEEIFFHIIHLSNAHLFSKMYKATIRLESETNVVKNELQRNMIICLIVVILSSIFTMVFMLILISNAAKSYATALTLLRRVSPAAVLTNKELADYLFSKKGSNDKERMTTYKRVIHDSANPIICCGKNGTIEIVNSSVTDTLGYTPEQLLGQQFDTIFSNEDRERVSQQVLLMKTGQASKTYEDHVTVLSDSESLIPCRLTLIGIVETSGDINSFAIGLVDETEAKEQEKIVEKAKADSENLLYQILPRDIVIKLNQGERDISFTIPSASVIFIDIQKFSDYAATLTPDEIMGNLSLIFDAFDSLLTKYPLMTKIKLIGDVYMGASGLFSPDVPPQQHAEQIIRFGLDALAELDEINIKLSSNLVVRIGVNSGGPLIGGVLGTDKPVFDIIGDTINVAARLQSTDIPGKIQIPQSTFDLIQGLDFAIEQRGEVMLKGKGKTMAYLVNPNSYFFTSTAGNILPPGSNQKLE